MKSEARTFNWVQYTAAESLSSARFFAFSFVTSARIVNSLQHCSYCHLLETISIGQRSFPYFSFALHSSRSLHSLRFCRLNDAIWPILLPPKSFESLRDFCASSTSNLYTAAAEPNSLEPVKDHVKRRPLILLDRLLVQCLC